VVKKSATALRGDTNFFPNRYSISCTDFSACGRKPVPTIFDRLAVLLLLSLMHRNHGLTQIYGSFTSINVKSRGQASLRADTKKNYPSSRRI